MVLVDINLKGCVMRRWVCGLMCFAFGVAPVWADGDLARKNACMSCHAVDKKLVGPAYADVAKKYAGQKDAAASLAQHIKGGGAGRWGPVPMPAQPGLSDADALTLANWVLAGAK